MMLLLDTDTFNINHDLVAIPFDHYMDRRWIITRDAIRTRCSLMAMTTAWIISSAMNSESKLQSARFIHENPPSVAGVKSSAACSRESFRSVRSRPAKYMFAVMPMITAAANAKKI